MKSFIKKIFFYDKLYPVFKDSFFYRSYKRMNAKIAEMLYNNPAASFFLIGVTGTNGKTTTVSLIHKILNDNLAPTLAVSTSDIHIGNKKVPNLKKMTSLDVFDLQSLLSTAKNNGCKVAVLETSSQGLDQERFAGIDFDVAVLTNITHDHLDYHKTMELYAMSKKQLFKSILSNIKQNKFWVFPSDDAYGRKRFEEMPFDKKINYSIQTSSILKATSIVEYLDHTDFSFSYLGQIYNSHTSLLGSYNVKNILAALGVGIQLGLDMKAMLTSLENFKWVEGRLQQIISWWVRYFVDFAHTPDGLEQTLGFLNQQKKWKKLIIVFGAPGMRDEDKRPIMGDIAKRYADVVICTDDDPSEENRLHVLNGLSLPLQTTSLENDKEVYIVPERKFAIQLAMDIAQEGDLVLLAGKGHEKVQLTNFWKRDWNDTKVVKELIAKKAIK